MTNKKNYLAIESLYHRLKDNELIDRRRELFPGGKPCGWERMFEVNAKGQIKSLCALTNFTDCEYSGQCRQLADYQQCPVYKNKLKQWLAKRR